MPPSPAAVAERFAPAGLAAVRAASDLQDRRERKYLVPAATFAALAEQLLPTHAVLEIDGRRAFGYRTTYLDTPGLLAYREHLQGRRRRFKCRVREYADSGVRVAEVKLKGARGRTVKHRVELTGGDGAAAARALLAYCLAEHYGRVLDAPLRPVLATDYTRVTLAAPARGERLTCDAGLGFRAPGGATAALRPGTVILESKSRDGDALADRILRALGARPAEGCSKYCAGVALTHAGVPANHMRPLLRRHFSGALSSR